MAQEHRPREVLDHDRVGEAVDDEPAEAVALGVDKAVGVGGLVEGENLAAQAHRLGDSGAKELGIEPFLGILGQDPQRDLRAVAPQPSPAGRAVRVEHRDVIAGPQPT